MLLTPHAPLRTGATALSPPHVPAPCPCPNCRALTALGCHVCMQEDAYFAELRALTSRPGGRGPPPVLSEEEMEELRRKHGITWVSPEEAVAAAGEEEGEGAEGECARRVCMRAHTFARTHMHTHVTQLQCSSLHTPQENHRVTSF